MAERRPRTALFPVFLKLEGRPVLVVGGGAVAAEKVRLLRAAGARVRVVAERFTATFEGADVVLAERPFRPGDLAGVWFVVAAARPEVNRFVVEAAEARRVFVNAVDDRALASAYLGGVLRRGGVTLAVSTDGTAPALAGLLREALEALLPEDLAAWVQVAEDERPGWRARGVAHAERRPLLLEALNRRYAAPVEVRS